jgi:hypothetical protein
VKFFRFLLEEGLEEDRQWISMYNENAAVGEVEAWTSQP